MMPSERSLTRSLIWRFRAAILLLSHLVKVLAGVLLARDYCSRIRRDKSRLLRTLHFHPCIIQ